MKELDTLLGRVRIWNQHLEKVCNEIGANELTFKPMPESNSAAWILVHLINGYREFVELSGPERTRDLLGDLPRPSEKELARLPFSKIFVLVEAYREAFMKEVERLRDADLLTRFCPAGEGKSWMDLVQAVTDHEIYHCGQLAYIARVLQQKARASREE